MNKISVVVLDQYPEGTGPRVAPTVTTQIDPANVAFAMVTVWTSTDKSGHVFNHAPINLGATASSAQVLLLFMVHPVEDEGIMRKFWPFNILLVVRNIKPTLATLVAALGQNFFRTTLQREQLVPLSFPNNGIVLDGKRIKFTRGIGDAWVNLRSVTSVLAPTEDAQGLVIKHYHPLPVPTLEYRVYVDLLEVEVARRFAIYGRELKETTFDILVPVGSQDVANGSNGVETKQAKITVSALNYVLMRYGYNDDHGFYQPAFVSVPGDIDPVFVQPITNGATPYFTLTLYDAVTATFQDGTTAKVDEFFMPLYDGMPVDDLLRIIHEHPKTWHVETVTTDPRLTADLTKINPHGDLWFNQLVATVGWLNVDDFPPGEYHEGMQVGPHVFAISNRKERTKWPFLYSRWGADRLVNVYDASL